MAQFGNTNQNKNTINRDIFQKPTKEESTKKYEAEPVLSNQRPAPWLGRNMLSVLTVGFLLTMIGLILYKIANPS